MGLEWRERWKMKMIIPYLFNWCWFWKRDWIGRVMEERMMGGLQDKGLLDILSDLVMAFEGDYTRITGVQTA
jgi:hypothetical protein